ncbi:10118_t:CDS:2, partial [Gigaspora rosea]
NQLINGRITNYDEANVMKRNGENIVNSSSEENGMNYNNINSNAINQIDERTEMIQTNINKLNYMNNNMNGNSGEDGDCENCGDCEDCRDSGKEPFEEWIGCALHFVEELVKAVMLIVAAICHEEMKEFVVETRDIE